MDFLINVGRGRPAMQSSLSSWSRPDDPRRPLSGLHSGSYAFHTNNDVEPFWSVDLQSIFGIRRIVVFNREDGEADRACPLVIETSEAGQEWREVCTVRYVFGGIVTGTPLDLRFKNSVQGRFVRLRRIGGPQYFHLDQVEIYTSLDDLPTCAQLGQDLWVLQMTGGRSGGTFVEIGSTDGVAINNTYLLESRFGWRGVCVEPNPHFCEKLRRNRTAKTFQRAVFRESGRQLEFIADGEFGTLSGFEGLDYHASRRRDFKGSSGAIQVMTISPDDLLKHSDLPPMIDFLSLDTEGTEWDILSSMDFSRYRFGLITVEHNHVSEKRNKIFELLKGLGYFRLSAEFDDWYYHPVYLDVLNGNTRVDFAAISRAYYKRFGYGQEQV